MPSSFFLRCFESEMLVRATGSAGSINSQNRGMAKCENFDRAVSSSSMIEAFNNKRRCKSFDEDAVVRSGGPVAILWDIENCPVPGDTNAEDVAGNIRMAIRLHPAMRGAVTMFSAYGDFNHFPRRLREGCQRTGVNLIDVPNGRKDASDKAILVDMFLFALDNPPPSTLFLISGDVDFAPALHKLGQRGYLVVLAVPSSATVSSSLRSAGQFVWDWPSIARGEGLIPSKPFSGRTSSTFLLENNYYSLLPTGIMRNDEEQDPPTEEQQQSLAIRKYPPQLVTSTPGAVFQHDPLYPKPTNAITLLRRNELVVPANNTVEDTSWVQPGDIHGLKCQLVELLSMKKGNKLMLVRIPSEYCKLFGRPLYLSEYGSSKLIHLLDRMPDVFVIKGEGTKKSLHLRDERGGGYLLESSNQQRETRDRTAGLKLAETVEAQEEDLCEAFEDRLFLRSDDGLTNEELANAQEYVAAARLEVFKQELQELLVSHACKIYLAIFPHLYERRYAHELDLQLFGVEKLESLIEKVKDVAIMMEEPESGMKLLIANGSYPS